ncbi:hypothetical protein PRIPAC_79430 [Pristionchus pacificus]|uniref:guanylate cyclase n=1 Tax=Pristionchus pacificus TaxID=54126 RepID=A0A2A6CJ16_PRIPA|nr:hypothetical protein PRIPAC_79430 [Pristionchus pacificus]|eukprot:PDM78202.1 Adenylate and Guanylate cyclase [Pristionchus pacificus]
MFGFIHESIRQLMLRRYGEELWNKVLERSGFEAGKENIVNHYYKDSDTYLLVDSVSVITKMNREQVWELYGGFLIEYTMEMGWDELVRSMSPNLKGFLDNLDSLHYFIDHVVYKANLRGPSFRCEENQDGTITLHYYTGRPGLYPIVKGVIREVARRVFEIDVSLSITGRTQRSVQMNIGERIEEHVIFQIKLEGNANADNFIAKVPAAVPESSENYLRMSSLDFATALPYHFIMDEECKLIALDFDNICNFINAVFVLQARCSADTRRQTNSDSSSDDIGNINTVAGLHLTLKGQMMMLSSNKHIIYLCSPYVTNIPELLQYGMRLTAMPLHDATRDIILLNQQRLSDVEVNLQLEANNEQLETMARDLEKEREKTDALLKDLLPPAVAEQFMNNEDIEAKQYEEASIMFSDVPQFAVIVSKAEPKQIVVMLNDLFTRFDRIVGFNDKVYKVETVGDCYMTVAGIPEPVAEHAEALCHTALGMMWESREVHDPRTDEPLLVRIGIHSGPVIAGVVGMDRPRYAMYGNAITTASLMETHSLPGRIQLSVKAYKCASRSGRFEFVPRGRIQVKGKGEMDTYFLLRSLKKSIWEITKRPRDPAIHSIEGYEELLNVCQPGAIENRLAEMRSGVVTDALTPSKACSIS